MNGILRVQHVLLVGLQNDFILVRDLEIFCGRLKIRDGRLEYEALLRTLFVVRQVVDFLRVRLETIPTSFTEYDATRSRLYLL